MKLSASVVKLVFGSRRVIAAFTVSMTLLAAVGCGGGASDAKDRASASGKAVFDGKPIPAGHVVFTHNESGTTANCPISEGEYSSVSGEGPLLGANTVTVSALDGPDGKPLFGGGKSFEADVASSGYAGDFTLAAEDVTEAAPILVDEEFPPAIGE
jgi:hypothetical protein